MGYFYDMFEKPQYKQIYMKLNEVVLRNNVPVMMEMDDDITGSMICGAPIMIDGKHVATWICCSYDDEDAKKMESVYKVQWQLGRISPNTHSALRSWQRRRSVPSQRRS